MEAQRYYLARMLKSLTSPNSSDDRFCLRPLPKDTDLKAGCLLVQGRLHKVQPGEIARTVGRLPGHEGHPGLFSAPFPGRPAHHSLLLGSLLWVWTRATVTAPPITRSPRNPVQLAHPFSWRKRLCLWCSPAQHQGQLAATRFCPFWKSGRAGPVFRPLTGAPGAAFFAPRSMWPSFHNKHRKGTVNGDPCLRWGCRGLTLVPHPVVWDPQQVTRADRRFPRPRHLHLGRGEEGAGVQGETVCFHLSEALRGSGGRW